MPSPSGTHSYNVEAGVTKNLNLTCSVTISDYDWTDSTSVSNTTTWVKGYPPVVTGATITGPEGTGWFSCKPVGSDSESNDNTIRTTKWYEDGIEIVGENQHNIHDTSISDNATTLSCSITYHDIDGSSPTVFASFDLTEIE